MKNKNIEKSKTNDEVKDSLINENVELSDDVLEEVEGGINLGTPHNNGQKGKKIQF